MTAIPPVAVPIIHIAAPDDPQGTRTGGGGLNGHPMCGLHLGQLDSLPAGHTFVQPANAVRANCANCMAAWQRRQQGGQQ